MVNLNELNQKPVIAYPCEWEYKVIFLAHQNAKELITHILGQREFELHASQKSAKGKYESFVLKLFVDSEADRLRIFEALKEKSKFVL